MVRFTQSPNKRSLQAPQQNRRGRHLYSKTLLFSRKTPLAWHSITLPAAKLITQEKKNPTTNTTHTTKPKPNNNRTTATENFSDVPWPQTVYRLWVPTQTSLTEDLLPKQLLDPTPLLPVDKKGRFIFCMVPGMQKWVQRSLFRM